MQFTESGAVVFSARKIGKSSDTPSVSDSGCGVPSDKVGHLFRPFRQADAPMSRRCGGSGLGLAICKSLIELMNGEISLSTVEVKGTTVTFCIPLLRAEEALSTHTEDLQHFTLQQQKGWATAASPVSSGPVPWAPDNERSVSFAVVTGADSGGLRRSSVVGAGGPSAAGDHPRRLRILLAEDNPTNIPIAIKILTRLGYDVDRVVNSALVLLALERGSYDVVLMDCMMPIMDGYTATRNLRCPDNAMMKTMPVIALTAAAVQGQRMCQSAGMTDFLSKPVRRATLEAMLVKWLGRRHVAQPIADVEQRSGSNFDGEVMTTVSLEPAS